MPREHFAFGVVDNFEAAPFGIAVSEADADREFGMAEDGQESAELSYVRPLRRITRPKVSKIVISRSGHVMNFATRRRTCAPSRGSLSRGVKHTSAFPRQGNGPQTLHPHTFGTFDYETSRSWRASFTLRIRLTRYRPICFAFPNVGFCPTSTRRRRSYSSSQRPGVFVSHTRFDAKFTQPCWV